MTAVGTTGQQTHVSNMRGAQTSEVPDVRGALLGSRNPSRPGAIPVEPLAGTNLERWQAFWENVRVNGDCWVWTGVINPYGYGQFKNGGKRWRAHRFIYEAAVGPLVAGLQIDHLCRVRACVRPDHLEQVTQAENNARGNSFSALNARKTHCNFGHPLSGENVRVDIDRGRPVRRCRECRRRRVMERYYRLRNAEASA